MPSSVLSITITVGDIVVLFNGVSRRPAVLVALGFFAMGLR